ncbi:MAG TPA: phosphoribosylamine--glycine ligase N-terminal domain-containing protein, partial [Acidimicrobiales bacterium]|nr:phosphoribosylamine--glycine ligase N-terminal domain-containing protein [Acidimicrobiales bacterium]
MTTTCSAAKLREERAGNATGSVPPRERRLVKVCVVGSGGREHALASVLARDADVIVTPGNAAMRRATGLDGSGAITVTDTPVGQIEADLYVIGPEAPLVDGLADRLRAA